MSGRNPGLFQNASSAADTQEEKNETELDQDLKNKSGILAKNKFIYDMNFYASDCQSTISACINCLICADIIQSFPLAKTVLKKLIDLHAKREGTSEWYDRYAPEII